VSTFLQDIGLVVYSGVILMARLPELLSVCTTATNTNGLHFLLVFLVASRAFAAGFAAGAACVCY